jgi:2-oxoglutarate dehydrogenase E2 component (dihydrolipoamide succinyltransferase)
LEAVAKAIKDFPMINVSVDEENIIVKEHINIGMATALPSGNLIVPVVKDADKKSLKELAADVNNLSKKARDNKLKPEDIKGSTFTISNVGTFGSVMGTPIINQPEVAILALGIIKKRAEVIETEKGDEIAIRSMMYLSLSFDHRVVDGYLGGSFLKRIADYLENFDLKRTI